MGQVLSSELPRLAPPGAGLPAVERVVAKGLFAARRWTGTREAFTAQFERERGVIAGLYGGGDADKLRRPVLIRRLRGLEDSSRFWSVYMTLDHLRIVNDSITGVIRTLTQGRVPAGQASTAAVKPSADCGPEVVARYEAACDGLVSEIASHRVLATAVRYVHPWFGALDAAGWHAMAAMHMGIHRHQIECILR